MALPSSANIDAQDQTRNRNQDHPAGTPRRVLGVACGAHAVHDGFTDALYVLLPVWQAEFGLSYAAVGALRALYTGAMASAQVPASTAAARVGGPRLLAIGTALAGLGLIAAGFSARIALIGAGLLLSGIGSSTQHPIASDLVAHSFAGRSRAALGTYNFAGDIGKMLVPAATALLLTVMPWRATVWLLGALGIAAALAIALSLRNTVSIRKEHTRQETTEKIVPSPGIATLMHARGFPALLSIGFIDSATRMGFLTFLPFLLTSKGADVPTVGLSLSLVFAGGAAGKLVCGFLGARFGFFRTVLLTELMTGLGILALLPSPLLVCMVALPLIGIALNGTSSVLYGSVPEIVTVAQRPRAFSVFYTGTIGGGAIAPVIYGLFSDQVGVPAMMMLIAFVVVATLPLAWRLRATLDAAS